jgi:fumarylacetoacetase
MRPMHTPPPMINDTHDPAMKSWVESANDPTTDFPLQNLPLGAFLAEHNGHVHPHLGVPIGDQILDVSTLADAGVLGLAKEIVERLHVPTWGYIAAVPGMASEVRRAVQRFLRADAGGGGGGQQARRLREKCLRPLASTRLFPPIRVGNYTDFYASIHHATTVGSMFRPDNPLLPNYKHVPIGYHGRASSIILTGGEIRRPLGQQSPPDDNPAAGPKFGPCAMLDYELEIGAVVGVGNPLGEPVPLAAAEDHILGLCLVNDWSARDVQKWEYQPLGPFLAKNFATSVSPFLVTLEALAPFRAPGATRAAGDPTPLPYLTDERDRAQGGFDLTLEVAIESAEMRTKGLSPKIVGRGTFREMYWTLGQMLTHHTSNGCNLQTGDLLASGTISGTTPDSRGCLLEATWAGTDPATGKPRPRTPIELPTGEKRTFLADGDRVVMRAWAEREGYRRIGFGECSGTIVPAKA